MNNFFYYKRAATIKPYTSNGKNKHGLQYTWDNSYGLHPSYYETFYNSIINDEGIGEPNKSWIVYNDLDSKTGKREIPTAGSGIQMEANKDWFLDNLVPGNRRDSLRLYTDIYKGRIPLPKEINNKFIKDKHDLIVKELQDNIGADVWGKLTDPAKAALLNIRFNAEGFNPKNWSKTFQHLKENNMLGAANEIINSKVALGSKGSFDRYSRNASALYPGYTPAFTPSFPYKSYEDNWRHNKTSYIPFSPTGATSIQQSTKPIATNVPKQQPSVSRVIPSASPTSINTVSSYRIRRGDVLSSIAKKHGVPMSDLIRLNGIKNPNKIQEGQVIKLPSRLNKKGSESNYYSKLAAELFNKVSKMEKEIPAASDFIITSDNKKIDVKNKKEDKEKPSKVTKDKLDIIIKKLYSRTIKESKDKSSPSNLEEVLKSIFEENKSYFPFGLTTENYNGKGDELKLVVKDGNSVGFIGIQKRSNRPRNAYYSVGILPEYRGKGIAKKELEKFIKKHLNDKDVDNHIWTADKNNKGSIALYNSLIKQDIPLTLKLF